MLSVDTVPLFAAASRCMSIVSDLPHPSRCVWQEGCLFQLAPAQNTISIFMHAADDQAYTCGTITCDVRALTHNGEQLPQAIPCTIRHVSASEWQLTFVVHDADEDATMNDIVTAVHAYVHVYDMACIGPIISRRAFNVHAHKKREVQRLIVTAHADYTDHISVDPTNTLLAIALLKFNCVKVFRLPAFALTRTFTMVQPVGIWFTSSFDFLVAHSTYNVLTPEDEMLPGHVSHLSVRSGTMAKCTTPTRAFSLTMHMDETVYIGCFDGVYAVPLRTIDTTPVFHTSISDTVSALCCTASNNLVVASVAPACCVSVFTRAGTRLMRILDNVVCYSVGSIDNTLFITDNNDAKVRAFHSTAADEVLTEMDMPVLNARTSLQTMFSSDKVTICTANGAIVYTAYKLREDHTSICDVAVVCHY